MNASSTFIAPQKSLIEILVYPDTAGNSVVPAYFAVGTTAFMLNRPLISLESFCSDDVPFSPINPGIRVISAAEMGNFCLTLLREPGNGVPGGDFYRNVPLTQFRRSVNGLSNAPTAPDRWICEPTCVSWSDSFAVTGSALTAMTAPISILLLASYLLPEQDPTPYRVHALIRK